MSQPGTAPHYTDESVTLHHGDCIDVLRRFPDNSVDSVVCDPPYGLEFMGKEWDGADGFRRSLNPADVGRDNAFGRTSRTSPEYRTSSRAKAGMTGTGYTDGANRIERPSFLGSTNPKCLACNRWQRGANPCQCDAPEWTQERLVRVHTFQAWCESWAVEALRVLKPGGHLLAFGGTRTFHRLTCAVEDAGFEIRDSIAWLYGSGFPKSLDVSKAIDKARGDGPATLVVTRWLRDQVKASGLTRAQVMERGPFTEGQLVHWLAGTALVGPGAPAWEQWQRLREVIGFADDMDAEVWRLNGRKGTPGEAWDQREIIGSASSGSTAGMQLLGPSGIRGGDYDVTAPATDDARAWQGWGTALKPGWEIAVHGTKPVRVLDRIGSHLDELERSCKQPASNAANSSAPTRHGSPAAKTATAPDSAATPHGDAPARTTPTGAAAGSSAQTDTSASESTAATFSNTVTSWRACWAELCEPTSTSTTGTTSSTTTGLETLWSCLSRITPASTTTDPTSPAGPSSLVAAVDAMFAAAVLNLRATRTLTAIGSATSETPPTSPPGAGSRLEPVVVARKPLTGTVAANVLAHGTGALNIDACRIGDEGGTTRGAAGSNAGKARNTLHGGNFGVETINAGRWPANVVLDESQAAALDQMSGEQRDGVASGTRTGFRTEYVGGTPTDLNLPAAGYGGSGGASRFFYTAKADAGERVRVNGIAHATVKPLSLMRWLVRLVTPPGGTVLDPFAGSGTTGEACILEGFACVLIEREADYLPLIVQRINRQRDPIAYTRAAGEDLGLFDFGELA